MADAGSGTRTRLMTPNRPTDAAVDKKDARSSASGIGETAAVDLGVVLRMEKEEDEEFGESDKDEKELKVEPFSVPEETVVSTLVVVVMVAGVVRCALRTSLQEYR